MANEFTQIIGPLAQAFFGEPNRVYSSEHELRYGSRGSFSVDLRKGTWYDHEANEGGGALDLVTRETKLVGQERLEWLTRKGFAFETIKGNGSAAHHESIVATYDYTDEGGVLLRQVVRYEPKDFKQRCPDGRGGWSWSTKGVRHVPYRLPQLLENDDRVIAIVEGEKSADRLWKIGIPATCSDGGAGKWRPELAGFFQGADVVVLPDYDPQKKHPKTGELLFHPDGRPILPGQDHAAAVAKSLSAVATRVRVLELWKHWEAMPLKGDVSNWIENGGTAEQLNALIEQDAGLVRGRAARERHRHGAAAVSISDRGQAHPASAMDRAGTAVTAQRLDTGRAAGQRQESADAADGTDDEHQHGVGRLATAQGLQGADHQFRGRHRRGAAAALCHL